MSLQKRLKSPLNEQPPEGSEDYAAQVSLVAWHVSWSLTCWTEVLTDEWQDAGTSTYDAASSKDSHGHAKRHWDRLPGRVSKSPVSGSTCFAWKDLPGRS